MQDSFEWSDGTDWNYENWIEDYPLPVDGYGHVFIWFGGYWFFSDVDYYDGPNYFLCKI